MFIDFAIGGFFIVPYLLCFSSSLVDQTPNQVGNSHTQPYHPPCLHQHHPPPSCTAQTPIILSGSECRYLDLGQCIGFCSLGSGRGAMVRAWVFQTRGPVFDSRRTAVVSGRASDLKYSCATLVYKSVDPR